MNNTPTPPPATEDAYGAPELSEGTVPMPEEVAPALDPITEFTTPVEPPRAPAPGRRPAVSTGPKIEILDPIVWQDQPVPERRWLVPDLIPMQNVTMLSGDGGVGKSIVALQLMVACALGKP